jgi:hypothetical protein
VLRSLNLHYAKLTPEQRAAVAMVPDTRLDAALLGDDPERALDEVARWRDEQLCAIEEARTGIALAPPASAAEEAEAQRVLEKFPEAAA